jgi:hypothetical protein
MSQETTPEAIAPKRPFPILPTSKILALGRFTAPPTPEQVKAIFPHEVPDTLQLYLDGKIEQMWARQDHKGPVFLMNDLRGRGAHHPREATPPGPEQITRNATVAELGADGTLTVLVRGTNEWVCVPGNENKIGAPQCA